MKKNEKKVDGLEPLDGDELDKVNGGHASLYQLEQGGDIWGGGGDGGGGGGDDGWGGDGGGWGGAGDGGGDAGGYDVDIDSPPGSHNDDDDDDGWGMGGTTSNGDGTPPGIEFPTPPSPEEKKNNFWKDTTTFLVEKLGHLVHFPAVSLIYDTAKGSQWLSDEIYHGGNPDRSGYYEYGKYKGPFRRNPD